MKNLFLIVDATPILQPERILILSYPLHVCSSNQECIISTTFSSQILKTWVEECAGALDHIMKFSFLFARMSSTKTTSKDFFEFSRTHVTFVVRLALPKLFSAIFFPLFRREYCVDFIFCGQYVRYTTLLWKNLFFRKSN